MVLQCRGPRNTTTGTVAINGRLDNCPFITGYSANALEAFVGASINIAVTATDFDAGDTIAYTWTASPAGVGTVAAPGSATTTFTCTAVGSTSLSIAVSDTICGDSLSNIIPINCLQPTSPTGGSGTGGSGVGGMGTGGMGTGGAGTGGVGTGGNGAGGGTGGSPCSEPVSGDPVACCSCTTGNCSLAPNPAWHRRLRGPLGSERPGALLGGGRLLRASDPPGQRGQPWPLHRLGRRDRCFCGNSGSACFATAGAANGPCTAQVIAAAKTPIRP